MTVVTDRLALVADVFGSLGDAGIVCVHWKSNEHLAAALGGDTDLDLLVEEGDRGRFTTIVDELGFLPMLPPRARSIPGIESYLGMDPATGKLVHLDVHFRVILGEQLLKNHHLPVERWLLADTAEQEGVAVPRPERELVLLYVRCVLKTRARQIARARLKGGSPLPQRILREAQWLADRVDERAVGEAVAEIDLEITADEVVEFRDRALEGRIDWRYVLGRRRSLIPKLRAYERLPRWRAAVRRLWLRSRNGRVMEAVGLGIPRRHLAFTAPVVAVVGADGSGKTQLTGDLKQWLGAKLIVRHVYFGQPKTGFVFRALNKPGSVARRRAESGAASVSLTGLAKYTDAAKWLMLAGRRRSLASRCRSAASRGEVVVAERYPLPDFHDMESPMDGPRLQPDGPFAGFEMRQYRSLPAPDLTIVLNTSVEVLRARKLDLTLEEHVAKVEAVASLEPMPGRVTIDASRPYDEVLEEAKNAVWGALLARR